MDGGDLVFLARSKAGITQAELGERSGRAQGAVARIESGKVKSSFETIRDLVRACGFEPEIRLATYDASYRRDIERRLLASSPAQRVARATDLARTSQRFRRNVVAASDAAARDAG